jgi:hypothetical protein
MRVWLLCQCRYLMPYLVPYGGVSWTLSCLLPPSSISLFASVLLKMEVLHLCLLNMECCLRKELSVAGTETLHEMAAQTCSIDCILSSGLCCLLPILIVTFGGHGGAGT